MLPVGASLLSTSLAAVPAIKAGWLVLAGRQLLHTVHGGVCTPAPAAAGLQHQRTPLQQQAAPGATVLHRGYTTTSSSHQPQIGGYMRTGAKAADAVGHTSNSRFLVTGACGQVGQEFVPFLRSKVGVDNVIASDVRTSRKLLEGGPFYYCDVQDKDNMARIMLEAGVTHVVHLATLLSAVGERNPALALKVNTMGIQHVLELAVQHDLAVYSPSTIAVFGSHTPRVNTPDRTIMQPATMYGITKVHQELLGQYYHDKYGVDYRSLRYPGIISAKSPPGGGTTDYAVEIFHAAIKEGHYNCFLSADRALPMLYGPDCLSATWQLMTAPRSQLQQTTYNVTALSFTPAELAAAIKKHLPHFEITYTPDFRDEIAKTWPISIDDSAARRDWGWKPGFDLDQLAADMLQQLEARYNGSGDGSSSSSSSPGQGRLATMAAGFAVP